MKYFPSISDFEDLRWTYIANCVFNSFLTYTAIILNVVTIYAIRKTSSLPNTLKTFLLSLAVSDVGVGLFVQPFYTSLLVNLLQQNISGYYTYLSFTIIGLLFSLASFLGVVTISVDRFLAVHLHLRYQELVTHKRAVAVVISVWLLSASVSLAILWLPYSALSPILSIFEVTGLFLTTVAYTRIYLIAKRHRNQIQAFQLQQGEQAGSMANFARVIKSAISIFYVYLIFLICYLPTGIFYAAVKINAPNTAMRGFYLFSFTLICLNSALNPIIYCWKMRHIRHAIMNILRNMSWNRNHQSH